MDKATSYQAVDVNELKQILKNDCSPDRFRHGYVIGPDAGGRLCHIASCYTMEDAKKTANRLNKSL